VYALYVTHPQVRMDPTVPVPRWGLSDEGRARAEAFARHPLVTAARRVVASTETKAIELAQILAVAIRVPFTTDAEFDENDRSSTGYVPAERFEQLADAFFAHPEESVEGWEPASMAQARIVGAFEAALEHHNPDRPIIFAGHGAVGTLLKCALDQRVISRDEDQRRVDHPGGGNVLVIRLSDRKLLSDWVPMEQLPATIEGL
jgi:broad specificity phosphatase PhoE